MDTYVASVGKGYSPAPEENVMKSIFSQYERVVIESLITSFGLDFMVGDQHGGDVDTILNVRKIGEDPNMKYKNAANEESYNNRGTYSHKDVEGAGTNYQKIKHEARSRYQDDTNNTVQDAYEDKPLGFLGKSKNHPTDKSAELDHVISAKSIHDDRGRVLSGLSTVELADDKDNLQWTNEHLNKSMGADEIPDYIKAHPELPEDVKKRMEKAYNKAKKSYENKLARAYYTSPKFAKDLSKAAVTRGAQMGIKQALGFVFAEIWFAVKEEFHELDVHFGLDMDLGNFFKAIGNGVKRGFENAKSKYKDIFERFLSGSVSGVLASVTTTICNIFLTTAKNVVKIIRLSYASLVQAAKVLFLNPDRYSVGDQMCAVAKILATGASVVVGTLVTESISKTPIGTIPVVGGIASTFCGTLVTGIMSCTLLYFFDTNKTVRSIVDFLNKIPSVDRTISELKQVEEEVDNYSAQLMMIDIAAFKREVAEWKRISALIEKSSSEQELNDNLKSAMKAMNIDLPWAGTHDSFDSFMKDKNAVLKFG